MTSRRGNVAFPCDRWRPFRGPTRGWRIHVSGKALAAGSPLVLVLGIVEAVEQAADGVHLFVQDLKGLFGLQAWVGLCLWREFVSRKALAAGSLRNLSTHHQTGG